MISLLAPAGLAALAALVLPIAIHLIRRSEQQEVNFAALRWVVERTRPRKQLQLHKRLLLVLRMMLLTTLALSLALPIWRSHGLTGSAWIAVIPGVDAQAAYAVVDAPLAEWHWLAPDFPLLEKGIQKDVAIDKTAPLSLIRQLDNKLPPATSITLIVPQVMTGLDAERPRLAHAVHWQVAPGPSSTAGKTDMPSKQGTAIRIAVRHDAQANMELNLVRALAKSWQAAGLHIDLDIEDQAAAIPTGVDWLFWLGGDIPAPARDWIANGGTALASRHPSDQGIPVLSDEASETVIAEQPLGRGRLLSLNGSLTTDTSPALLEPDFPEQLRALLNVMPVPPDRAAAKAVAPENGLSLAPGPVHVLDHELALLAALLYFAERVWATWRLRKGS